MQPADAAGNRHRLGGDSQGSLESDESTDTLWTLGCCVVDSVPGAGCRPFQTEHHLHHGRRSGLWGSVVFWAEEVYDAYVECGGEEASIDWEKLNDLMVKLLRTSVLEGLEDKEFEKILESELPKVYAKIDLNRKIKIKKIA